MSWVVAGIMGGSMLIKGASASGTNLAPARAAAQQIKDQRLAMLKEQQGLTTDMAGTAYETGGTDISLGMQTQMDALTSNTGRTNLATSGTMQTKEADLRAKAQSDIKKLVDTRAFTLAEADLSYRSGETSAIAAYEDTITGIEQTPDTFLEGMFS